MDVTVIISLKKISIFTFIEEQHMQKEHPNLLKGVFDILFDLWELLLLLHTEKHHNALFFDRTC